MNIVFDIKNVMSFLSIAEEEKAEYNILIKRGLNIIFNFSEKDLNKKQYEQIGQWQMALASGKKSRRRIIIKFENIIDTKEIKSNFITTNILPFKRMKDIYLLDNTLENDNKFDIIISKGHILLGKVGEETRILDSIVLEGTEKPVCKITWREYCPKLPLTDIIISDNHFFKEKVRFEQNIDDLFSGLCKYPVRGHINCIIFIKHGEIDKAFDLKKKDEEIMNELCIEIKKKLKKFTGFTGNVTIVSSYRNHDRCIITNYYRIKIGSTVQINDPGTKSDVIAETKTNAEKQNEDITDYLLDEYQKTINNAKTIVGDKRSNFLEF